MHDMHVCERLNLQKNVVVKFSLNLKVENKKFITEIETIDLNYLWKLSHSSLK